MFGLSIQEKLYKLIWKLCDEKLPFYEKELTRIVNDKDIMNSEDADEAYKAVICNYSDEISSVLAEKFGGTAAMKAGLALQCPKIAGFPEEMDADHILDTGPLIGYYWGLWYYGLTGNKIALSDYGKYIRPLNKHQVELMDTILVKLGKQMSE